jgi:[protein-PII] uridylyltransferase
MHWERVMQSTAIKIKAGATKRSGHAVVAQTMLSHLKAFPPKGIFPDEIDAHFEGMPSRYWERIETPELVWGLEVVHKFLEKVAEPMFPGTTPVLDWKHFPESGFTKVMLCTWDRQGLLAKAASAFSAVRVNILNADAYTRADQIVLDVFRVCDAEHGPVLKQERLEKMLFLLEGSLSDPPRFASFWAASAHKREARQAPEVLSIAFDNSAPGRHTALRIETDDRIGLLSDILEALANGGVNVDQALIETHDYLACDTFCIYEDAGEKITEPERLSTIRELLAEAIRN